MVIMNNWIKKILTPFASFVAIYSVVAICTTFAIFFSFNYIEYTLLCCAGYFLGACFGTDVAISILKPTNIKDTYLISALNVTILIMLQLLCMQVFYDNSSESCSLYEKLFGSSLLGTILVLYNYRMPGKLKDVIINNVRRITGYFYSLVVWVLLSYAIIRNAIFVIRSEWWMLVVFLMLSYLFFMLVGLLMLPFQLIVKNVENARVLPIIVIIYLGFDCLGYTWDIYSKSGIWETIATFVYDIFICVLYGISIKSIYLSHSHYKIWDDNLDVYE